MLYVCFILVNFFFLFFSVSVLFLFCLVLWLMRMKRGPKRSPGAREEQHTHCQGKQQRNDPKDQTHNPVGERGGVDRGNDERDHEKKPHHPHQSQQTHSHLAEGVGVLGEVA